MIKLLKSSSWTAKRRRWVIRFAVAFIVYSLGGFLLLPALIKWQLEKQLPKSTKRIAAVRQVLVNPWTLSLTIRGLSLKEPTGEVFASWEEFKANFQLSSLFRWAWTFKEIHLIDPHGAVILQRDGKFNFANMFEGPEAKPKKNDGVSRVRIFLLSITNGFVSLEDLTHRRPFRTEYRPINIVLRNFTTRPGTGTPYSFRAENDTGKTLAWEGDITAAPFSSRGRIDLQNGEPGKYQPYLDDYTRAEVTQGKLDMRGDYFVSVGTNGVDFTLANGFLRLKGLKVNDPDANETILSLPDLALEGVQFNLRERQATADTFIVRNTEFVARLNEDGSFNFLRLLVPQPANATKAPSTNSSSPWTINLAEFKLENATVNFEDRSRKTAFRTRLNPIDFNLKGFTTRPESDSSWRFSIVSDTSEKLEGSGTVSINPVRSGGELSLAGSEVKKHLPYLEPFFRGEILSGKVDVNAAYQFAHSTEPRSALVSNIVIRLTDLQLKSPDNDEKVVSIPEFSVEGGEVNVSERSAKVARTRTTGGSVIVRREADGKINLQALLQPSEKSTVQTNSSEITPPVTKSTNSQWTAVIDEIALENYSINFEDKKPAKPAVVKLDQLAIHLKGISTDPQKPVTTELAVRVNESGSIGARGTVIPAPLSTDMELSVTNLDLRAAQPYLEERAKIELVNGSFNLASRARWERTATNSGHLQFEGGLSISGLTAVDQLSQDLVKWTNLAVDGIKFELQPNKLHIDTIRWEGLVANLLITSNKQLNVSTIVPKSTNAPAVDATPVKEQEASPSRSPVPFPVTVSTFALSDSAVRLKDDSVHPPSEVEISEIAGTITGLSSDSNATADVKLAGSVGERSPFSVTGQINPLASDPRLNLTISNSNVQLPQFTSYMEKYTGHPLNRGRLSMTLHYDIQGKQLNSQNKVQLDQLTLGPRTDNTNATDLPVKLGVALLKDSHGRIELDVPVSGRLDDPQFRLGPIIMKVIVNMITKAVASPFKLIGAAVGGGEELSFLEFEPGTAQFIEGETNKIGKLVKALHDRPGLSVDITASVDPKLDRNALAREMVEEEIKTVRLQELAAVGQTLGAPDAFEVEPGEKQRLLRAAVVEKFGTNLNVAIQEMRAALTNIASGSASGSESSATTPKEKWYKKVLVPFQKKDSPEAVARRQAKADAELLKQNPELGGLSAEIMEKLLASKVDVPPDAFLKLMKARAEAAHAALVQGGQLGEDRVLLIAPKPIKEGYKGEARVDLSLN